VEAAVRAKVKPAACTWVEYSEVWDCRYQSVFQGRESLREQMRKTIALCFPLSLKVSSLHG